VLSSLSYSEAARCQKALSPAPRLAASLFSWSCAAFALAGLGSDSSSFYPWSRICMFQSWKSRIHWELFRWSRHLLRALDHSIRKLSFFLARSSCSSHM
jgi:hypothetical protein